MKIELYLIILGILLVADYALAVLHTYRLVPLGTFLAANFPFGAVYVWFESHWTGNQYRIGNQVISEAWPFWTFFPIVFAQAWAYYWLFSFWLRMRSHHNGAAPRREGNTQLKLGIDERLGQKGNEGVGREGR